MNNPNQTSAAAAKTSAGAAKNRPSEQNRPGERDDRRPVEQPDKPSLHARARNLIAQAGAWLEKPFSLAAALLDKVPVLGGFLRLRVAWVMAIFVVGFAAGGAWQSHGSAAGKSAGSSERLKAMSLALSTARKSLDKLANDMSRLEAQGMVTPQRRSPR